MTFRRVLRLLGLLLGIVVGAISLLVAYLTRRMVIPARQPLWTTPADMGMPFEDVNFPAQDSVRLSGWFIPAPKTADPSGATVVLVHDWTWNRLGDAAADLVADLAGTTPVEFLRLAHALHLGGYHVFMYDQRNHGESASHPPVTFGRAEAYDLIGAIGYLQTRSDVASGKIGVIGFSMGANAVLYALPQTGQITAAVAVQPMTMSSYVEGYSADLLGLPGKVIVPVVETLYSAIGGVRLSALQPAFAAAGGGNTPVLFIQCKSDHWGSMEDVDRLRTATPEGEGPLYVDGTHRYQGYQYLIENPKVAMTFFERYF